jgi:hypothetical protein
MCEYCEGDIWDRKTIESDCRVEYTIGNKELLMAFWSEGAEGLECEMESEMQINYCPICGRKL